MKKIEGLFFLSNYFPRYAIDTSIVDNELTFNKLLKRVSLEQSQFWRVRCANPNGSELALPMGSFYCDNSAYQFIRDTKIAHPEYLFILHRINNNYYYPNFCGSLSVSTKDEFSEIIIELQQVNKEMIDSMDAGIRPRDWEVSVSLKYVFLHPFPNEMNIKQNISIENIKCQIKNLFDIGVNIYNYYYEHGLFTNSYTRFNICKNGDIILNDHRSSESFI